MANYSDRDLLEAAITGYEARIAELQEKMNDLRSRLGGRSASHSVGVGASDNRRFSAAARERMAAAQRKRWAEYRTEPRAKGAAKASLSAAARRKLSLAAKARWARLKKENPNATTLGG